MRKWLKDNSLDEHVDPRTVIDWPYYLERVESMIQKLIVIPAAMQGVSNPVPRVNPPSWLHKRAGEVKGEFRQMKLSFGKKVAEAEPVNEQASDQENVEEEKENARMQHSSLPDMEASFTSKLFGTIKKHGKAKKPSIPKQAVTIDEDYSIWIQQQRPKWRALRMQLSRRIKRQPRCIHDG